MMYGNTKKGTKEIVRTVCVIHIDGVEFTSDDYELMEKLCWVDGFVEVIMINDPKQEKRFIQAGLIEKNIRGCWGTEKLKDNLDRITKYL